MHGYVPGKYSLWVARRGRSLLSTFYDYLVYRFLYVHLYADSGIMDDVRDHITDPEASTTRFSGVGLVAMGNRTRNQSLVLLREAALLEVERSEYFEYVLNTVTVPILFGLLSLVGVLGNVCGPVVEWLRCLTCTRRSQVRLPVVLLLDNNLRTSCSHTGASDTN